MSPAPIPPTACAPMGEPTGPATCPPDSGCGATLAGIMFAMGAYAGVDRRSGWICASGSGILGRRGECMVGADGPSLYPCGRRLAGDSPCLAGGDESGKLAWARFNNKLVSRRSSCDVESAFRRRSCQQNRPRFPGHERGLLEGFGVVRSGHGGCGARATTEIRQELRIPFVPWTTEREGERENRKQDWI